MLGDEQADDRSYGNGLASSDHPGSEAEQREHHDGDHDAGHVLQLKPEFQVLGLDGEAQVVDCAYVAEALGQMIDLYDGHDVTSTAGCHHADSRGAAR